MLGVYFSGTGNTKYCVEKFLESVGEDYELCSIEDADVKKKIQKCKKIVFGYPIYYSNLPKIVREFIFKNPLLWKGKNIYVIATMGLFSGDGAGLSARAFRKFDANIIGGLHLKMPDCIGDVKKLKKSLKENRIIVKEAENKIHQAAEKFKIGNNTMDGLSVFHHMAGLFGQRLYFYNKTKEYSNKLKINGQRCIQCKTCVSLCPMSNLKLVKGEIITKGKCTMCYRCVNNCPQKAITLLGNEVIEQCRIDNYIG